MRFENALTIKCNDDAERGTVRLGSNRTFFSCTGSQTTNKVSMRSYGPSGCDSCFVWACKNSICGVIGGRRRGYFTMVQILLSDDFLETRTGKLFQCRNQYDFVPALNLSHLISKTGDSHKCFKMHKKNRGTTLLIQYHIKLHILIFYYTLLVMARVVQKKTGKYSEENIQKSGPPIYMVLFEPSRTVLT